MISPQIKQSIDLSKQILETLKGDKVNGNLIAKLDIQQDKDDDFFRPVVFVYDDDGTDPYFIMSPSTGDKNDLRVGLAASAPLIPIKTLVLVQDAYMKTMEKESTEEMYPDGMSLEQQYLLEHEGVHQALTVMAIDQDKKATAASLIYRETDDGKLVWGEELVSDNLSIDEVGGALGSLFSKATKDLDRPHEERVAGIWTAFLKSDQAKEFVSNEEERTEALTAWDKIIADEEMSEIAFRILEDNILGACQFIPLQQSDRIVAARDKFNALTEDSETFKCLQQARLIS